MPRGRDAEFHWTDRPLSSEVEIIEDEFGTSASMSELISLAPIPALDEFSP